MRICAFLVAVVCALTGTAVAEDRAAQHQERGEQLAKDGRYSEAIEAFKAGDAITPNTARACLIALAYSRRNLYGQAELYFDACHRRASDADPVPTWLPGVERQFRVRLTDAKLARVTIKVTNGTQPKVVVSAFSPDEAFEPRTIYLPLGRHTLTITSLNYPPIDRVVIVDDATAREVAIDLDPAAPQPVPQEPERPASPSHLGRNVMFVGIGLVAAGAVVHATWLRSERDQLTAALSPPDPERYRAHADRFRAARYVTVGLYAAGAITVITGLVLRRTKRSTGTEISVTPTTGGGILSVEWAR